MITIIFESHATSLDNEAGLASGHNDVELSEIGRKQSKELGERYADQKFDAIFCSDLRRSYETAQLAFGDKYPIIKDARLRECDYGEMTQHPTSVVNPEKAERIIMPFPSGESYEQCCARVAEFVEDITREYDGKTIMIIGHRATQYGLEHAINHVPVKEAVTAPWKWRPGWRYEIGESTRLGQELIHLISMYPKFDDGRINYSDARVCPVVNCVVRCDDMVLMTRRGDSVLAYPNTINGISGFIDEIKPLEAVVYQELSEEVGLSREAVKELKIFPKIVQTDDELNREWHVYPALAVVDKMFEPRINWENKEAVWMKIDEAQSQELMWGFREVLKKALEYKV